MLSVIQGDALEKLRELPDESVQCCVTSPPYWGLRDYGTAAWEGGDEFCDHAVRIDPRIESSTLGGGKESTGHQREGFKSECPRCGAKRIDAQLGLEKTPELFVQKMVEIFREVRRVLRRDGTLWLNLGDSYASIGHKKSNSGYGTTGLAGGIAQEHSILRHENNGDGLKHKDLCGIPWRVAFALQADGWWLRSDIIWAKPNPMPESVTDRPTKSHEYLFLLTKSANYFYDAEAIKEQNAPATVERAKYGWCTPDTKAAQYQGMNGLNRDEPYPLSESGRNKRSVWTVATAPYPEAHFATYPPDLIKPCIMAGTSAKGCCARCGAPWERIVELTDEYRELLDSGKAWRDNTGKPDGFVNRQPKDHPSQVPPKNKTLGWQPTCNHDAAVVPCTVLDPFAGSGTTGAVALELGRKAVLIELNPKYVALIEQRCSTTLGLALA